MLLLLFLHLAWQEATEIKCALEKFATVAGEKDTVPLTSEQVTQFAAALDADSDGKVDL